MDTPGRPSRYLSPVYFLEPGPAWSQPLWVPALTDIVELRLPFAEPHTVPYPTPELYKGGALLPRALKGQPLASGSFFPQPSLAQHLQHCPDCAEPQQPPIRKCSGTVFLSHLPRSCMLSKISPSLAYLDKSKPRPACHVQMHTCFACDNSESCLAQTSTVTHGAP